MLNIKTETLERALELRKKIEALEAEFAKLMGVKLATPKASAEQKTAKEKKVKSTSSIKGKKRSKSVSGPLADAVVKVLERYGRACNIQDILEGLSHDGYIWNVDSPKKNLSARVYKLNGVYNVSPGFFDLVSRKPAEQPQEHHQEHHHG